MKPAKKAKKKNISFAMKVTNFLVNNPTKLFTAKEIAEKLGYVNVNRVSPSVSALKNFIMNDNRPFEPEVYNFRVEWINAVNYKIGFMSICKSKKGKEKVIEKFYSSFLEWNYKVKHKLSTIPKKENEFTSITNHFLVIKKYVEDDEEYMDEEEEEEYDIPSPHDIVLYFGISKDDALNVIEKFVEDFNSTVDDIYIYEINVVDEHAVKVKITF